MAALLTHRVSLVGSHSAAFAQEIQNDSQFEVHEYSSDSTHQAFEGLPAVVAFAGGDYDLSEIDVNRLLRGGSILALFSPPPKILKTIHRATRTPLDIASLKVSESLPFLVYLVDGVVHVAPNSDPGEVETEQAFAYGLERKIDINAPKRIAKAQSSPTELPKGAVRAITRALAAIIPAPQRSVQNLEPPSNVIGFGHVVMVHSVHLSIDWLAWRSDGQHATPTDDPSVTQQYVLDWSTDIYAYATGADCRNKSPSEFEREGGKVFILAIDQGSLARPDGSPPRYLGPTRGYCSYYFADTLRTGVRSDSMRMLESQPSRFDSNGSTSTYNIDYQQDMQMLSNNGASLYTFPVHYATSFQLDQFRHHQRNQGSSGVDYDVNYKGYYDTSLDPDLTSDTWWNPGVFKDVDGTLLVQPLPQDNIPISNLTVFSTGLGTRRLDFNRRAAFRAFKSDAWITSSDGGSRGHRQRVAVTYSNPQSFVLDVSW